MAKRRPKVDRRQQRAQDATLLRYGPEIDALNMLVDDIRGGASQEIRQARTAADAYGRLVDATLPQAQAEQSRLVQRQTDFLRGLGPLAPTHAAEAAVAATNAGLSGSALTNMLLASKARQQQAAQYQAGAATRQMNSDLAKVQTQRSNLARQAGVYAADFLAQQLDADRKRAAERNDLQARLTQDERNSIRSSGTDPDTGQPTQNAKNAARGKSKFTPESRRTTSRTIRSGVDLLAGLKVPRNGSKASIEAAKKILLDGIAGSSKVEVYKDPVTGKKKSRTVQQPAVAKAITNDRELAGIIAERYVNGGLSDASNRRLRGRYGITARPAPPPKPAPTPRQAGRAVGKSIMNIPGITKRG
jgi:hypothetical protein